MLKIIAAKGEGDLYRVMKKERPENFGKVLDCPLDEAQVVGENISIFGDKSSYLLRIRIGNRNVVNEEDAQYLNNKFFESLHNSEHLFFLHGYGAEFIKLCEGQKIIKIEEVMVNDFPAELVTAIQKHDKKNSWDLLVKELAGKDAEPIHGSCIFAYKTLLTYLNDTKKNSTNSGVKDFSWNQAKRNAVAGKRERGEVVDKYFDLVVAYHEARLGQLDLAKKLEMWVLEK